MFDRKQPNSVLSRVRLFATPWTAAHQVSLSITNSWSLLKLMSIESVMPSSHLILCCPLLLLPPIPPSIRVFSMRRPWGFSPEARRGSQGASRAAPGKSGLHARGEGERLSLVTLPGETTRYHCLPRCVPGLHAMVHARAVCQGCMQLW